MAENVPFSRTMLHGLMGRLQVRFTPRATPTSKADIWRLAAVDPLMVSHRGRPQGPSGALRRSPDTSTSLQTLCAIHLLIQKTDMDDKLLDLFPDLVYTLLLQLSSNQGPEAASPVLKTWRLVHTGTLPEEINLHRCSRGEWEGGAGQWA